MSVKGLKMTPTVGFLSTTKPSEMQTDGKACTKLVVPSMGSQMKVGADVRRRPGWYVSSPMKEYVGYFAERTVDTIFSTAWSVSVTMSAAGNGQLG